MVSFSFGKRRKRYNVAGSPCNKLSKRLCGGKPGCVYTRRRGCRRRSGTLKGMVYQGPSLEFGKRRRRSTRRRAVRRRSTRYRRSNRSACSMIRRKSACVGMCSWKKGRGCRRAPVKRSAPDFQMTSGGDEDLGAYAAEAGIEFFGRRRRRKTRRVRSSMFGNYDMTKKSCYGRRRKTRRVRRRRYNVAGSGCNKLKKRICRSNPNCTYTRRGCRRRKGTATKGVVYQGPSLQFGKRRRQVRKSRKVHHKKLPAKIRKLCKRLGIKCTKKVGSRRVYKKLSVLKKQIARKMRKMRRHRR